ncbi:MAG: uracil-DNA glycosylase [Candidatus Aminicenantales bacterium]
MRKINSEIAADLENRLSWLSELGADFLTPALPPARAEKARPPRGTADAPLPSFAEIEAQVLSCRLCPLSRLRTHAVPGEGNKRTEIVFVGEAPGRDEDLQGRPFIGRAGQLLTKIIEAMKFKREEVYITNVVKCRPPENRTPNPDEVRLCSPYLVAQIDLIAPRVIVTLGKVPTDYFVPGRASIGERRGRFFEYKGIKVMPTYHPAYVIRNEGNREIRQMVWDDMKQVMKLLGKK